MSALTAGVGPGLDSGRGTERLPGGAAAGGGRVAEGGPPECTVCTTLVHGRGLGKEGVGGAAGSGPRGGGLTPRRSGGSGGLAPGLKGLLPEKLGRARNAAPRAVTPARGRAGGR